MTRTLSMLALLFLAANAHAQFSLSPAIIAVAPKQYSEVLSVKFFPGGNSVAGETSVRFNLDQFGWVELKPAPKQNGMEFTCELVGGVARATVMSTTGAPLPSMYVIPVCNFRVRPHYKTPLGNYYLIQSGGFWVAADGTVHPAGSSTQRVIVDD